MYLCRAFHIHYLGTYVEPITYIITYLYRAYYLHNSGTYDVLITYLHH